MATDLKIYEDEEEKQYRRKRAQERWQAAHPDRQKDGHRKYAKAKKAWQAANRDKLLEYAKKSQRRQRAKHFGEPKWIENWIKWVKSGSPGEAVLDMAGGAYPWDRGDDWAWDAEEWDGVTDDIIWAYESHGRGLGKYDLLEIACQLRVYRDILDESGMKAGRWEVGGQAVVASVLRHGDLDQYYENESKRKEPHVRRKGTAEAA